MKSRLTLLALVALGSAITMAPTHAAPQEETEKKAGRLQLRKKYRNAKALYEERKKAGAPAAELAKLEKEMKKARRKWRAAVGITAAVAATAAAAAYASKKDGAQPISDGAPTTGSPASPTAPAAPGAPTPELDLQKAIESGQTSLVDQLIKGNENLYLEALHIAIEKEKQNIVDHLIKGDKDEHLEALAIAIEKNKPNIANHVYDEMRTKFVTMSQEINQIKAFLEPKRDQPDWHELYNSVSEHLSTLKYRESGFR